MTEILARRLRELVILDEVGSNNPLGREAADELERLERENKIHLDEIERLRKRIDELEHDALINRAFGPIRWGQ